MEREIVQGARAKIVTLNQQLEDTRGKLVWTDKELKDLQPKIDQIGLERDQYKSMWEKDHEALLKSETAILRRNIIIGSLLLAIGLWAFLKFYVHVPFL